ncbi:peptidase S9 [Catellatospora sp. TT07R-123]|uniref:S9 family peptidase n=1 Tax=Catellatospora sp. TT07R-123 TaxID=2733863 RepID=UPI001B295900|nr:S9 family peptidase [Catellatospora sp. TT07R-123]GHJ50638.1 peptidase S9 [Catellatospora sp. TT07R-123]
MPSYRDFRPTLRFQPILALSADCSQIAYADDASGQFNLTVRPVVGGPERRVTDFSTHTVRKASWHPDGRTLIFQADQNGDERTQLYAIAAEGGEPTPLTDVTGAQFTLGYGAPVSPDGKYLTYVGNDRSRADQDILVRDLTTGEVNRIYEGDGRLALGHWSPDGSRLSMALWREGYDHVVHILPASGGPTKRLTSDEAVAAYWLGPWLPDGSGFIVRSNAGREFTGLAVIDADSGELTWIDTPDWDVEAVALSADGRTLVWVVNVGGASQLRGRDLRTGTDLPMPELPLGQADAISVSADGAFAVVLLSTPTRPWNAAAIDLVTGQVRWLTDSVPGVADPATFVDPILVHYPTHDGRQVPAYLYLPAGATSDLGVLLSIHGGPVYQERPAYVYDGFYQYLVSHGVAVLAPNARGSSGYGKTYEKLVFRDWGGGDLGDFAASAQWLREQDWVDPARLGLFGASYGAFGVLSCLARLPEMDWAAGVDLFGPSNLVTLAEATPPAFRALVADVIGDPDTDAEMLLSRSPITYVDQIRAPLFVLQGANDPRVPRGESDQLVERLRARGVEVRYDVYPDEGHGFVKSENQIKARSDAADFLIERLNPEAARTAAAGA